MNIRMYNVQYGECFLLCEEEQSLVVDFGSDTPGVLQNIANDIRGCTSNGEASVLLSHFHCDHINGLWETDLNKHMHFRNVYIPDIFAMRNCSVQLDMLQLIVLEDIFNSVILQNRPIQITLYQLLLSLIDGHSRIKLLRRGSNFDFGHTQYQVLWPCFDTLHIDPRVEKSVIKILEELDLISYQGGESFFPDDRNFRINLGTIDSFIDELLNAYRMALNKDYSPDQQIKQVQEALEKVKAQVNQKTQVLSDGLIAKIKCEIKSMHSQGNRISIVFQDKAVQCKSRVLMTGDCKTADINKLIDNRIASFHSYRISHQYEVIKAPHHGTKSHFCSRLPTNALIMISNGEPSSRNRIWGKISDQYGLVYHHKRKCKISCTNQRCELAEALGMSKCNACGKSASYYTDIPI